MLRFWFMRKVSLLLIIISLVALPLFADQQETRAKITRIKKEITRLENKLTTISSQAERKKILGTIYGHHARIRKLEEDLVYQQPPPPQPVVTPLMAPVSPTPVREIPEPVPPPAVREPIVPSRIEPLPIVAPVVAEPIPKRESRLKFELGGVVGLFSSATAINGEIRFPLGWIIGPATSSIRATGSFVQTEDTSKRYALVACDGILNFPAGWLTGVENYLGAGLNYTVATTGSRSGTFGGELFYGIESPGFGGRIFSELGFAIIRTGFAAANRGVNAQLGFRKEVGLF